MPFIISLPDEEELQAERNFRTYKNYLKSLNLIIENIYEKEKFYINLKQSVLNQMIVSRKSTGDIKIDRVKKLLFNSWCSEIILNLPNDFDPSLKLYSNLWAPVQAYYSIYLALRALIEAKCVQCREDHTTTLSLVASWIRKGEFFLIPWNIYCKGCVEYHNHRYYNLPNDCKADKVSPLSNPSKENMWDFYCLMLRTTRRRLLERRKIEWKRKENRKRMKKSEIFALDKNIHPTTFFDNIYRLRIRSNYQDADAFMMGTQTPEDASGYHLALTTITKATLFIIELYICMLLGKETFKKVICDFIKRDRIKQSDKSIKSRIAFFGI